MNTKAWITKYALTEGIQEVEGRVALEARDMFCYAGKFAHGNDWHETKAEAIVRAEQMRVAKIASLKKSIERLERLRFK